MIWRKFGKILGNFETFWEIFGDFATLYALSYGEKLSPKSTFVGKKMKNMRSAPELAPHPVALGKAVDDHGQPHRGHHDQVGHGQVDHEHVAWRSQGTSLRRAS